MPVSIKPENLTACEARLLERGRMDRFIPKGKKAQVAVCALMARGLMTLNGAYHGHNCCWTTFQGGMALAEYSSRGGRLAKSEPLPNPPARRAQPKPAAAKGGKRRTK